MFIFGTNNFGKKRCNGDGCKCQCETSASGDGSCKVKNHKGYRLYKFGEVPKYSLVAEKKECGGSEAYKGRIHNVEACASICNGVASMFIFGTNKFGKKRCNGKGCKCSCETSALEDGSCKVKNHKGYQLYKFDLGKIFIYS